MATVIGDSFSIGTFGYFPESGNETVSVGLYGWLTGESVNVAGTEIYYPQVNFDERNPASQRRSIQALTYLSDVERGQVAFPDTSTAKPGQIVYRPDLYRRFRYLPEARAWVEM